MAMEWRINNYWDNETVATQILQQAFHKNKILIILIYDSLMK